MNGTRQFSFKKRAAAAAIASCLSLSPLLVEAAGLGKLTVLSGLGQPLRAELDIGASKDEVGGMTARLAPQDAFRQAGVDYASVLHDLRFTVDKRPNGQAVVRVTSNKPVNEPFLDFLVELTWPSGRLVREYTFLLDPPEIAAKQTAAPVAEARVVQTTRGAGAAPERMPSSSGAKQSAAPRPVSEPKNRTQDNAHLVRAGETLRKIATENKYDGVSLEQMLVGYLNKNPEAFVGNNVNRLKAGAILNLPDRPAVEAVSESEARKVYVAQSADWNAYRQKLAATTATTATAPAREDRAVQASSGKITAKVDEKIPAAEQAKDQVRVSKTEAAAISAAAGKAAGAAEADLIAREKALKEAQERLTLLEKNIGELQKLVEMKNQKLADLQQQAAPKKEDPAPVSVAKPVEAPKAVEVKPAEPQKPVDVVPAEQKPAEVPKPVAPPPPKKETPPAPEPEPEPGFMDSLLEDPVPLAAGGGILALLAGFFLYKRRREQNATMETTAAPAPSSLGPNSVFRMTGGQSVDTGNTPPQTGDFSQTGPGTIDTDEVDPVAEADVYMAYGRDTQAEEILLEALQKDPQRTAIHAKLLEIYANRRSLKQFETLAGELYAQTGGVGPEWEKVAALGAGLDPGNPLYSGSKEAQPAFDADATMVVSSGNLNKATLVMPGELAQMSAAVAVPLIVEATEAFDSDTLILTPEEKPVAEQLKETPQEASDDAMSLDFDLGIEASEPESASLSEPTPELLASPSEDELYIDTLATKDSNALDFDLDHDMPVAKEEDAGLQTLVASGMDETIDFDLELPVEAPAETAVEEAAPDFSPEGTLVMPSEMDRATSTFVGLEEEFSGLDMPEEPSALDLELDADAIAVQTSINPVLENSSTETVVAPSGLDQYDFDNPKMTDTVVNSGAALDPDSLDFDVKLTDSVFLGQPMMQPDFTISSINLDLSADVPDMPSAPPVEVPASVEPDVVEPVELVEPTAPEGAALAPTAEVDSGNWEEVNTKLDLAKAYEEMGDLEGARELLQEVVGEGPVDLVEQARSILDRIGE